LLPRGLAASLPGVSQEPELHVQATPVERLCVPSPASPQVDSVAPAPQSPSVAAWQRRFALGVLALTVLALLARFVALEASPPGFFYDEATGATHALCVAEAGRSADGERLPLFFTVPARETYHYAPFVYSAALWVKAFGSSPGALRAMSALSSCLAILALALLAARFTDRRGVLLVTFAAASLPWSFHFARVFWDPAILPALLVGSLYFFVRSERLPSVVASGLLAGLAMHAYPPARLVVPLAFAPLVLGRLRQRRWLPVLLFGAVVGLVTLPILVGMWSGELQSRFRMVTIFTTGHLIQKYGSDNLLLFPYEFVRNFAAHLSPDFLFFGGDRNLRHSTGHLGVLGWLGALALAGAAWLAWDSRGKAGPRSETRRLVQIAAWWAFAGLCGAGATWESIPHSLRASGAWPFIAILMGVGFRALSLRGRFATAAILAVACAQTGWFGWSYFVRYPREVGAWFDLDVTKTARQATLTGEWDAFFVRHRELGPLPLRYFLIHYANVGCAESAEHAARVLGQLAPESPASR
jgi:4-amino-4-deoxy-L-arabinose transferase-like glycosyltransferase